MKTNYSISTSLPAYRDNESGKQRQQDEILALIGKGHNNLKSLERATGLPQGTISGRMDDLQKCGLAKYDGEVVFDGRRRKRIVLISQPEGTQQNLFA